MASRFSFSKRYNKEKVFTINTSSFDYVSLEEMYHDDEAVYPVRGVYINEKSLYDPAPVLATDDCYVNLPSHILNECRDMIADRQAVSAINRGLVGFTIYKYHQARFNRDCYSVKWVDIDEVAPAIGNE